MIGSKKKYDVYSIGNYCVDIIIKPIDHFPQTGLSIDFDTIKITTGGCSNNTAIALSRLGNSVVCGGLLGKDKFGDQILEELKLNGVDRKGIIGLLDFPTSVSIVLVNSNGERSFICNQAVSIQLSPEHFDSEIMLQSRIMHIAGFGIYPKLAGESFAELLKKAKSSGLSLSMDTTAAVNESSWRLLEPLMKYINFFLPSHSEVKALLGIYDPTEAAEKFLDAGVEIVVIKMGENGNYVATHNKHWLVPTFDIKRVDTCGAGDTFVAGFLTGMLKGWDPLKSSQFANAVGSLCVSAIGATTGIVSLDRTRKFIKEHKMSGEPVRVK